jgi:hypothetical protein
VLGVLGGDAASAMCPKKIVRKAANKARTSGISSLGP